MPKPNAKISPHQIYIHYMELLDEHPDSADTMRHVPEILLQNCSSVYQNGCVVLVGDQVLVRK